MKINFIDIFETYLIDSTWNQFLNCVIKVIFRLILYELVRFKISHEHNLMRRSCVTLIRRIREFHFPVASI